MKKSAAILFALFFIIGTLCACKQEKTNSNDDFSSSLQSSDVVSQDNKAEISYLHEFTIEDESENILITNSDLKSVTVSYDSENGHCIVLSFNDEGAKKFTKATKENMGCQLFIKIDGETLSAPRVFAEITDGIALITGLDEQEALDIYDKLT